MRSTWATVYPRTRGATKMMRGDADDHLGLSPHARGNLAFNAVWLPTMRSIPARAGQPSPNAARPSSGRVYPRTRGATAWLGHNEDKHAGLSPHARGNHGSPGAGRLAAGLSPHARGNPAPAGTLDGYTRSIPARAGQPRRYRTLDERSVVYPRTRGATGVALGLQACADGLSPHARGNQ